MHIASASLVSGGSLPPSRPLILYLIRVYLIYFIFHQLSIRFNAKTISTRCSVRFNVSVVSIYTKPVNHYKGKLYPQLIIYEGTIAF